MDRLPELLAPQGDDTSSVNSRHRQATPELRLDRLPELLDTSRVNSRHRQATPELKLDRLPELLAPQGDDTSRVNARHRKATPALPNRTLLPHRISCLTRCDAARPT